MSISGYGRPQFFRFPQSMQGPPGPEGPAGASWHFGDGTPQNAVGQDGEFYYDYTFNRIYGPKVDGDWPADYQQFLSFGSVSAFIGTFMATETKPAARATIDALGKDFSDVDEAAFAAQVFRIEGSCVATLEAATVYSGITAVELMGYYGPGDRAGRMVFTKSALEPSHRAKVQSADGAWWELSEPFPNICMFGAKGDDTAADDLAFEIAIEYLTPRVNRLCLIPDGTYKLTSSVKFTGVHVAGFRFIGASRLGTVLKQYGDDEAIFEFQNSGLTHSMHFKHFTGTWATAPTTAKTKRSVFYHNHPVQTDVFNCEFEDVFADKGYYVIRNAVDGRVNHWGQIHRNMGTGREMCGGYSDIVGWGGAPNNQYDKMYLSAAAMVGPIFRHSADDCRFEDLEINELLLGPQVIRDWGGGCYRFENLRLETLVYSGQTLFDLRNSEVQVGRVHIGGDLATFNGENTLFRLDAVRSDITHIRATADAASTGHLNLIGASGGKTVIQSLNVPDIVAGTDRVRLTDNGSTASQDYVRVVEFESFANAAYRGDESVVLSQVDAPRQIFDEPLTADRTVTLPNVFGNNLFSGRPFRIVKQDGSGAGALTVTGTGFTYKFPPHATGFVEVRYNRGRTNGDARTWELAAVGTLEDALTLSSSMAEPADIAGKAQLFFHSTDEKLKSKVGATVRTYLWQPLVDAVDSLGSTLLRFAEIYTRKLFVGPASTSTQILSGIGSPEGVITAPVGSIYLRSDGAAGSAVYLKESGAGNTGWNAAQSGAMGVLSVNARTGAVTILSADVTGALGFTPADVTRTISPGTGLAGGGDLSANRSLELAVMPAASLKGNNTAGVASPDDLTVAEVVAMLAATDTEARAGTSTQKLLTPANSRARFFESAEQSCTLGNNGLLAHGLGVKPTHVQGYLRCKTAELGFVAGDEIPVMGLVQGSSFDVATGVQLQIVDATNIRFAVGDQTLWRGFAPTTGHETVAFTPANWAFVARAWAY